LLWGYNPKGDRPASQGAGHHSVFKGRGNNWYIVYHRRPLTEKAANSRVVCIDKLEFDEAGLIRPVKITNEGVEKTKLK
jgi:beta-xylosidase